MMETKWFGKSDEDGLYALFRMDHDVEQEVIETFLWDIVKKEWVDWPRLVMYFIDQEPTLVEVTESQARDFAPDAFTPDVAKGVGEFEVSKAVSEEMFTLGPMYIPDRLDAHSEWTSADELQKAVWEYVKGGDRRIRLQHDRDEVAGEWVEVMTWPYEVQIPMIRKSASEDETHEPVVFPANTVFLGVKWKPWAWELVKAGKIRGYSIGGRAERLFVDLEDTE
jgi:hypothetical protein